MPWSEKAPLIQPVATAPCWALAAATCDAPSSEAGYRIYAVGGIGQSGVPSSAAYDPSANRWELIEDLPTPRASLAATSALGRVHAVGGSGQNGGVAVHEIYEPGTGTWSPAAPMPTARYNLAAVTAGPGGGMVYALGGSAAAVLAYSLATVEAYDPAIDRWISSADNQIAPMQTPRSDLAAVTGADGLIYAIGGEDASGSPLDTVEVFDPSQPALGWTFAATKLPADFVTAAAAVGPDGLIYVIGYVIEAVPVGVQLPQALYSYNPVTGGPWQPQAPMPTARSFFAAVTGPDGLIYAIGGCLPGGNFTVLDTVEAFAVEAMAAPDPYIGNGTGQSADITFSDANRTAIPLEPNEVTWQPGKQYGVQAVVYNDSTVSATETIVRFWLFINTKPGQPLDGTLIGEQTITVPPNGSITVPTNGPVMVGYQGLQGASVAVSIANPRSQYFNVDPSTAAQVLAPTVERPPGSGHYGTAWRGYPDVCLNIEAQLATINPGDFNTLRDYEQAVVGLKAELAQCRGQWGGPTWVPWGPDQ
jgi:hypothetical protein